MPAGLPQSSNAQNLANPSAGDFVQMHPFSGPKGSPFDNDSDGKASTGGLNTGIGMNAVPVIGPTAPGSIRNAGFNDDYVPGVTLPSGAAAADSRLIAIGGGRSNAQVNGLSVANPYTAGFGLVGAGNGASRDGGAGPAFTGFGMRMVTAAAVVANGAVVEAGFNNRSGVTLAAGQSVFGSAVAANAAPA